MDDALAAARSLLKGPRLALITSLCRADAPADWIEMVAVSPDAAWRIATPLIGFDIAPNMADMLPLYLWVVGVVAVCMALALTMAILTASDVSRSAALLAGAMGEVEAEDDAVSPAHLGGAADVAEVSRSSNADGRDFLTLTATC